MFSQSQSQTSSLLNSPHRSYSGGGGGGGSTEYGQTSILEQNLSVHRRLNELGRMQVDHMNSRSTTTRRSSSGNSSPGGESPRHEKNIVNNKNSGSLPSMPLTPETTPLLSHNTDSTRSASIPSMLELYNNGFANSSIREEGLLPYNENTIRFQVVIWQIGQIDMVQGRVPVTFRVTIFWNAPSNDNNDNLMEESNDNNNNETSSVAGGSQKSQSTTTWKMHGRQLAVETCVVNKDVNADSSSIIDVPSVSILNVVTFTTIGEPEVSLLREDTQLYRWSCMYRATLFQDHWEVDKFPHDEHYISLRLAILAHRQRHAQWDRNVWKLALATKHDSQGSVRIPHGLVVDHVSIPEFRYNKHEGLQFDFVPLDHGPGGGGTCTATSSKDSCLEVKLRVLRNSSYYDRNIMPLLGMLNFVAISITALEAQNFFERALLTLNITFVEIGMRMTADSKLPTASYQIKMQRILNEYFFGLLFLVLESLLVYELHEYSTIMKPHTGIIDAMAALAVFSHNAYTLYTYYHDAWEVQNRVLAVPQPSSSTHQPAVGTSNTGSSKKPKYNRLPR